MNKPKPLVLRLNSDDNVVVVLSDMQKDTRIASEDISSIDSIAAGHKMASAFIKKGEPIRKYGQIIGFAASDINAGEHVHSHNVSMGDFNRDYAFGADATPPTAVEPEPATFAGIVRPDGRVATRPSGRTIPAKVAGSGSIAVGGVASTPKA